MKKKIITLILAIVLALPTQSRAYNSEGMAIATASASALLIGGLTYYALHKITASSKPAQSPKIKKLAISGITAFISGLGLYWILQGYLGQTLPPDDFIWRIHTENELNKIIQEQKNQFLNHISQMPNKPTQDKLTEFSKQFDAQLEVMKADILKNCTKETTDRELKKTFRDKLSSYDNEFVQQSIKHYKNQELTDEQRKLVDRYHDTMTKMVNKWHNPENSPRPLERLRTLLQLQMDLNTTLQANSN